MLSLPASPATILNSSIDLGESYYIAIVPDTLAKIIVIRRVRDQSPLLPRYDQRKAQDPNQDRQVLRACICVLSLRLCPNELMIPVIAPKVSTDLFIHPLIIIIVVFSLQKVPDCNNNSNSQPSAGNALPASRFN